MNQTYLSAHYNNPQYSDFQFVDENGSKLYLHKVILAQLDYFATFFNSGIGNNKDIMVVDDLLNAGVVIKNLYDKVTIEGIPFYDVIEQLTLIDMWVIDKEVLQKYYSYMEKHLFVEPVDLQCLDIIIHIFKDYKELCKYRRCTLPRCHFVDKAGLCEHSEGCACNGRYKYHSGGDNIVKKIVDYLINRGQFDENFDNTYVFTLLPPITRKIHFCDHKKYDKLIAMKEFSLRDDMELLEKYSIKFTKADLGVIMEYEQSTSAELEERYSPQFIIQSLSPFVVTLYKYLGIIRGTDGTHLEVKAISRFGVNDRVYVGGEIYEVEAMYIYLNGMKIDVSVVDLDYQGIYHVTTKTVVVKGRHMWRQKMYGAIV